MSQSLLDGSLKIRQAEVHFSELQPRFTEAARLPDNLQHQLAALSREYLNTINAGLDANTQILFSLGLDSANQARASSQSYSPDGDMDQVVRHYQELCKELIISGPGASRPAAVIADELQAASARVRLLVTQQFATVPSTHD